MLEQESKEHQNFVFKSASNKARIGSKRWEYIVQRA